MSARVTETEVREIFEETDLTDAQILPYITSANILVNEILGTGNTSILKEIERWLACHMMASSKSRSALKEAAGSASVTYTGKFEQGLKSTPYGQMVLTLDTTGLMATQDGKIAAQTYAVKSFT